MKPVIEKNTKQLQGQFKTRGAYKMYVHFDILYGFHPLKDKICRLLLPFHEILMNETFLERPQIYIRS